MAVRRLHSVWKLLVLLPIPLLWCALAWVGAFEFFENRWVDWRFRYRGEIEAPVKIVYVDIDSRSLDPQEIGGWPWSRSYFEVVCRTLLERAHVKAIGIDVVLSDAGVSESADRQRLVEGNQQFYRFLHNDPPVVLAAAFSGHQFRDVLGKLTQRRLPLVASDSRPLDQIEAPELPSFLVGRVSRTPPSVGLIDTENAGTRAVPLYAPTNVRTYYHMAVELARRYWELPLDGLVVTGDHLEFRRSDGTVVTRVPLRDQQFLDINWFSRWSAEQNLRVSFSVVYAYALNLEDEDPVARASAEAFFAQEEFRDAIVLIGPVDPLLQDLATTPFDDLPVPKVSVHGNVLKSMISGRYLQRLPLWGELLVIMLLSLAVTVLALSGGARSLLLKAAAGMLALGYAAAAFELFRFYDIILPMVTPLGAAFTASFVGIFWQVLEEQKAKGRLKAMFGTYLAPEVVEQMIDAGHDPQLGGHDKEITAYFSDIQSFTSFAEILSSAQLGELLNEYLTACTDIVQSERGTLDKYIGDAVVAMFGAPVPLPDHAYRACVASQRVQLRLSELREKWSRQGGQWPALVGSMRTRIGLNTGVCMIGNIGSRTRFNYTMMGDNVNLASRMESGAKRWGVYTMVTDATKAACLRHADDQVVFRRLGRIVVVGRAQPVPIYEIVGLKDQLSRDALDCVELFSAGLARYYVRDWAGAHRLFERSAALEPLRPVRDPGVKTNPSLAYQEIVADMIAQPPPEDWDGVYVMAEK